MLTERTFDTGELTLAYLENDSSAPPLVLLHGLTGWRADWNHLAPLLEPDWHIYMPELRGHGNSGRGEAYGCADYARDIIAFLRFIGEPVTLVGFSLGALVALTTASLYPQGVRVLIPIDPPLITGDAGMKGLQSEGRGYFHWVYDVTKTNPSYDEVLAQVADFFPPELDDAARRGIADQIFRVDSGTVASAIQNRAWDGLDFTETIQRIATPTLMIHGDWAHGAAVRDEDIPTFRRNLPSAQIVRVPDTGHLIPMEHPELVRDHINRFSQSVSSR